jgi:two-component system chemotaxis sensor kinase CheA
VVVKNLEANYRKVPGVSGATILGDGRVALILDVGQLVRRARH